MAREVAERWRGRSPNEVLLCRTMKVSVRELRNDTAAVVAAVRGGQPVTLTSRGEPIADIVPHRHRPRWVSGEWMRQQLAEGQADPALTEDLQRLVGQTIDEL